MSKLITDSFEYIFPADKSMDNRFAGKQLRVDIYDDKVLVDGVEIELDSYEAYLVFEHGRRPPLRD